jgi:hypothetical protein
MSTDPYVDRFLNHVVHQRLAEISKLARQLLDGLESKEPSTRQRLLRIADGTDLAITRLAIVDARWVGPDPLAKLDRSTQDLINSLQSFAKEKNAAYLKTGNTLLDDGLLATINSLPFAGKVDAAVEPLSEVVTNFRSRLQSDLDALRVAAEDVRQKIIERSAELTGLQQATKEQTQRLTKQNERVDSAIAELNRRAADIEQQREVRFTEFQREEIEKQTKVLNDHIEAMDKIVARANVVSDETLQSLEDTRTKVAKIYGSIGNEALTGDYKRTANSNEIAANTLRRGAIIALTGMAGLIAVVAFSAGVGSVSWDVAIFRLTAAIALAAFATYLARESTKHRAVADKMRRLELELASIDSFTAFLPDEQRNALKGELARKYFANHPEPDVSESIRFRDVMKEARAFIRALRKGG